MFLKLTHADGRRVRIAADKITSYIESGASLQGNTTVCFEEGRTNPTMAYVSEKIEEIDRQLDALFAPVEVQGQ